jgi:iron complex transport system ATP-binding protein
MAINTALAVNAISLNIHHKKILSTISLTFPSGQFYGVLGPNGAGKTTLLKIISGQLASEGDVRWRGRLLADYPQQALAREIAVVNQINDTVFALSAYQVVTMGLLPHKHLLSRYTKDDTMKIIQALEDVGLGDKKEQAFSALSGGEQQRCLIARALVQGAPLLILDEPVNHLDVYYQHQILHLLHTLCKQQQKTVIVSLHDLNLASAYCDHLTLLDAGHCVAHGTTADVLEPRLLSQTFKLPCQVHPGARSGSPRVEFIPLSPLSHGEEHPPSQVTEVTCSAPAKEVNHEI